MSGPMECSGPPHDHVLMCPVQATDVAMMVVLSGLAKAQDGIGTAWWALGLKDCRVADAEQAVQDLVAGGLGERYKVTARDVIRRVRAIRHERHQRAPEPVVPDGLEGRSRSNFIRWYWTAVGNGERSDVALELAAGTVGMPKYLPPSPADEPGEVDPEMIKRARAVIEQSRRNRGGR